MAVYYKGKEVRVTCKGAGVVNIVDDATGEVTLGVPEKDLCGPPAKVIKEFEVKPKKSWGIKSGD